MASTKSAKTATSNKTSSAKSPATKATKARPKAARSGSAATIAEALLTDEAAAAKIAEYGSLLVDAPGTTQTQAARVIDEIGKRKPELIVALVDKLVTSLTADHKRVVQTAADALPAVARVAPARVARHLERLKGSFGAASDVGKDGLVRTFTTLCSASVAYQKRLEPVLTRALGEADGKTLLRWTEIVLPALKGEPHARARAVVERRLNDADDVPRPVAQRIADFLGIKLRPAMR